MKNIMKFSKALMATMLVGLMVFSSCVDDEYDTPEIEQIPTGDVYTIKQIKDLYEANKVYMGGPAAEAYEFTEDASIYATVTMDNETDNSYKTFYIQDATGAIAVFQETSGGVYIGDSVRIYLKNLVVMQYAELFQINSNTGAGINIETNVIKQAANKPRNAEVVELSDIDETYQGKLVKINNVQFVSSDTSKTYADPVTKDSENRYLQDTDGNEMIVRTSGYSTFAGSGVAKGSGSITAIVGQYNSDMQLIIRRLSEVELAGERFDVGGGTGDGEGSGTFDDPYNVAAGLSNQGETGVWVEGYIVGVYETQDASGNNLDEYVASFGSPFNTPYNLLVSDNQNETSIANCVIVQLTSGEIRNTLNLVDNSSNLSKTVKVYGDLTSYFSDEGLKNTSGYWIDGAGINPDDPIDVVVIGTSTTVSSLDENFTGATADADYNANGWLGANIKGERYWQGKEYEGNGYVQATGYGATASELESWIITPGVDLSTAKKLNFDTKTGYYKHDGLTVYISTDFDGDAANIQTATWNELSPTIATGPSNNYGDWVNSGDVDLSSYSGTGYILFKYVGDNSSNTTTFQLDNVKVINQ